MDHLPRLCACVLALASCSSDAGAGDTDGTSSSSTGEDTSSSSTGEDTSSSGSAACQELIVDLVDEPCVRFGAHELADFLEDCGPVTCAPRSEAGDGKLPTGLSVGPDCAFQGLVGEDRVGGWAQIVDVERDGQSVPVPFCAVQEQTPAGYSVEFSPGPVTAVSFDASGPISLDEENPTLRVQPSVDCPGSDCSFSFSREVLPGGFDPSSFIIGGAIEDEGGTATLVQSITANADEVAPEFADRPWVFSVEANYCMQPAGACNLINPQTEAMDAFSALAVIMHPQD